jgi:hypothetical protein
MGQLPIASAQKLITTAHSTQFNVMEHVEAFDVNSRCGRLTDEFSGRQQSIERA